MINQIQKNNCRPVFNELRDIVESLSKFKKIRKMSPKILSLVMRNWNNCCAICGGKKSEMGIKQLDGAHIIPVEEGGENFEGNLLPLCRREKNIMKPEGNIDLVGCHQLYDNEGIWSRDEISGLKRIGPNIEHHLKRPQYRKPKDYKQIEFLISMRRTGQAREKINELLSNCTNSPLKRLELLILQLRCERRRRAMNREKNIRQIKDELAILYKCELERLSENNVERLTHIEYENAMVYFSERDFKKASEWLRKYKTHKSLSANKWLINEAQACVSDFEEKRNKNDSLAVEEAIRCLEKILPKLDKFGLKNPHEPILNTWRVAARLHLARMKAYMDDTNAMKLVQEAEKIRDCQDAKTGWKSYTAVLLLHAKGECYRTSGNYEKALQILSLAARKILTDKYKNYEYLDNVFEGLSKIPKEYYSNQGQDRSKIEKIRKDLLTNQCI